MFRSSVLIGIYISFIFREKKS